MTPTGDAGYPFQSSAASAAPSSSWIDLDSSLRRRNVNNPTSSDSGSSTPKKVASYLTNSISSIIKPHTQFQSQSPAIAQQPINTNFPIQQQPSAPVNTNPISVNNNSNNPAPAIPVPAPVQPNPQQAPISVVDRWRIAQRYKTRAHWRRTVAIGVIGILLLLIALLAPNIASFFDLPRFVHHLTVRIALATFAVALFIVAAIGFFRFYASSPSLEGIPHRRRRLLGLPYDPTMAEIEPIKSQTVSLPPAANPAFSSTINANLITPVKLSQPNNNFMTPTSQISSFNSRHASGVLTNESQLTSALVSFERQQNQLLALQTPTTSQQILSPYHQQFSNQTFPSTPYQTSVRFTPTSIPNIPSHGKLSVEDERSDSESMKISQELYQRLNIINEIHQWERNIRHWLARVIIQPIARELQINLNNLFSLASEAANNSSIGLREDERNIL